MNKKALYYGLAYSAFYIAFKLFILVAGYSLTKFGYFYSNITAVILVIPFFYLAIKDVRDKSYGGFIRGKEALRIALTVFAVSAVLTSVYNYYEYEYSGKQLAIEYYNSDQFLDYMKRMNVKSEEFSKIISEQIEKAQSSAFRATTGKLFSFLVIGLSSALIVATMMKKKTDSRPSK
jgi:ammonia channel protein AmtB